MGEIVVDEKKLLLQLKSDVLHLKRMIKYYKYYNIRNFFVRGFIHGVSFMDHAFPFVLSAVILWRLYPDNRKPFSLKKDIICVTKEITDISNGIHLEEINFNDEDIQNEVKYSTGWKVNDDLYERTVTSYLLPSDIDNIDDYLQLSKEELDQMFKVSNVNVVKKSHLENGDDVYQDDIIVAVRKFPTYKYDIDYNTFLPSLVYILMSFGLGFENYFFKKIFLGDKVQVQLKRFNSEFLPISEEEIQQLEIILAIRQENLSLLDKNVRKLEKV